LNVAGDVWVGGYDPQNDGRYRPELLHWDGTVWSPVPVPHPASAYSETLWGVGGTAATGVWAVGWWQGSSTARPLAFHGC
jgi:hypothetical protein